MQTPRLLVDGPTKLYTTSVSSMDNNVYLLIPGNAPGLLIDAADDADALCAWLADTPGVETIATTHQHWDHVRALRAVAEATDARCVAGEDAAAISQDNGVPVEKLADGSRLEFGDDHVDVIELRGHTPGGACYVWRPAGKPVHLFTGDSLFPGGIGKTNSPADFRQLLDDVTTRLFDRFDDDTVVLPGHGKPTTLGDERPHLAEWHERGW